MRECDPKEHVWVLAGRADDGTKFWVCKICGTTAED
jgi:rubrerythrin